MSNINNTYLIIVDEHNTIFSKPKTNTPKMYNAMKAIADKYSERFNIKYKVKRCMFDRNGKLKFI